MLYNEIQEPITISREELEQLWHNPELSNADIIRGLRKIIKERFGYEYVQEIIRGIYKAEGMDFRQRRGKKVYPIEITENNISKRIHKLGLNISQRGKWASYECISTETIK